MSRAEISSLTIKHFYKALAIEDYPETIPELLKQRKKLADIVPLWQVKRIKTSHNFFTFSSPQSTNAILDCIEETYRLTKYNPLLKDSLFAPKGIPVTPHNINEVYI